MPLLRLSIDNWNIFKNDIEAIERSSIYPLGNDFFKIDHGKNYFSFFERLGEVYYYGWIENGKIVAVMAGVLRNLPLDGKNKKSWYFCDLKIHPEYRGFHIPVKIGKSLFPRYLRNPRGYAISMNSIDGTNRMVKIASHLRWLNFVPRAKLLIWSLSFDEVIELKPLIEKYRGPISFLSLEGVKDIIIQSTGKPIDLLHFQFGPFSSGNTLRPRINAVHMFCATENDLLAQEILRFKNYSASATILSHRIECDWSWVLTSEI
ncbi:MAG: hypothetical protein A4S09_08995 [Proteobacteria bacterium SG_bin7]|nr:MAG: hypothetical protein A4S09_08995 [Proteobacteria bacterium SG_bin7]